MQGSCDVYWLQESHEQDVNKIKMIHKAEMIKLQQILKVFNSGHHVMFYI